MASSSYHTQLHVFTSFHGPDVRKTFLSHLRKQFNSNGITMFDDNQGIERGQTIDESLKRAIRNSRIAIVLLSKNYASSSWCLDELLEIMKCKEELEQIVMTVFHGVEPSDVRKQGGEFGKAFDKICDGRPEDHRQKWSQALTFVSNIAGQDFQKWGNEVEMIDEIASEVSSILKHPPSSDFNGMVGLKTHLREIESLLDLDNHEAKFVGICGPAGIGKSTIARALYSRLSNRFELSYYMENVRGIYEGGIDTYSFRLYLHEQFLSKIWNLKDTKICYLATIKESLHEKRVLIVLDDVDSLVQLETLARNRSWFGFGSRIIVVTEYKRILKQHGIRDIYQVGFPSERDALKIFCLYTFGQTSPPDGFMNLANEVAMICCNLPLGLHVFGSTLRGKNQADWKDELPRLKSCLDSRIEGVLKEGYESLNEYNQRLFLYIAVFFNHEHADHVISMLETSGNYNDVKKGMNTLASKYLIQIDRDNGNRVVMQRFLQVMAREIISRQELLNRHILVDTHEICNFLEKAEVGVQRTVGISFNVAEIEKLIISVKAFKILGNLRFLKVYGWRPTRERQLHIPKEMEYFPCFPGRLRLLDWYAYPRDTLPPIVFTEKLIELHFVRSKLVKLWQGNQRLPNLKIMNLLRSSRLKELPNLSHAPNLERLDVSFCTVIGSEYHWP